MPRANTISIGVVIGVAFALTIPTARAGQKAKAELPAVVAKAVRDNHPNAEIDKLAVEKIFGVALYDIEFKAGKGEIAVAEDGTVIDTGNMVDIKEVPGVVVAAIQKVAPGATIKRIIKSEVRAEIRKDGVIKLATPRRFYEADLVRDYQRAEVQVAPDGQVTEPPKWK